MTITTQRDASTFPDLVSLALLDRTGAEIPTLGLTTTGSDVLIVANIDSDQPDLMLFASDPTRYPNGGNGRTSDHARTCKHPIHRHGLDPSEKQELTSVGDVVVAPSAALVAIDYGAFYAARFQPTQSTIVWNRWLQIGVSARQRV